MKKHIEDVTIHKALQMEWIFRFFCLDVLKDYMRGWK
jgi:hypothetical protein